MASDALKTFDDLIFGPHPAGKAMGTRAQLTFPNGYGVSVIQGQYFYTTGADEYELAVFHNGRLCYDTPITNDVIGHLRRDGVTTIMADVQALPKKEASHGE